MHFIMQVKKRPEIPEQDNDKMGDSQAAELAWKHHQLCNESIIVELFQVCSSDSLTALIKEDFFITKSLSTINDTIMYLHLTFARLTFVTNIPYSTVCWIMLAFILYVIEDLVGHYKISVHNFNETYYKIWVANDCLP